MDQNTAAGLNGMGYFIVVLVIAVLITYIACQAIKSRYWGAMVGFIVTLILFSISGISTLKIVATLIGAVLGNLYFKSQKKKLQPEKKDDQSSKNN